MWKIINIRNCVPPLIAFVICFQMCVHVVYLRDTPPKNQKETDNTQNRAVYNYRIARYYAQHAFAYFSREFAWCIVVQKLPTSEKLCGGIFGNHMIVYAGKIETMAGAFGDMFSCEVKYSWICVGIETVIGATTPILMHLIV